MKLRPKTFGNSELKFIGKPLAPGIARGKAYLLKRVDLEQFRNDKSTADLVSAEWARIDFAILKSKDQISRFMRNSRQEPDDHAHLIFEADLLLLNDPTFISSMKELIERAGLHGESVLAEEIARLRDKALGSADEATVKGLITMQDLYYRLLYNILPASESRISSLLRIPAGSILIADRLTPVEVAVIPMDKVAGILIEESMQYSHASIMAQTLGVPIIIGFPGIGPLVDESTEVLVDAYRGYAFLNPSEETVKECRDEETRLHAEVASSSPPSDESIVHSLDGLALHLLCNACTLAEVKRAQRFGIRDIGLFRSEIRYLANTISPSDQQETAYYAGLFGLEGLGIMTFRLLDFGGDKLPVYLQMSRETDPQLGCRGVRFLLSHPDLTIKQLRTILAARNTVHVRILVPFITTVDDLLKTRKLIDEVLAEMSITDDSPHVGIMVEVPSVAMSIEKFLPKVDFVCLGTNDLLQYFFAVNRDQDDLQPYNRFTHPAFLKLLRDVISSCEQHGVPLTVCGEMASDPEGCCLLAALGAANFSIQPDAVHSVRQTLSMLNVAELRALLPILLDFENADEVEQRMKTLDRSQ
ncbi:MAG TPA: phosphoenolpyruvate--protein phosphotransferase [Verrucomicrobia bacterium]|nr:MAG: phosphoenolpyruvate--protein phosphotransferase [Lentisphaerae bacterium GWF2_57_35]HBA84175.1 phosphoenolpyruvate--protein phosphotransferase [Verrucomicrobiota bacterium]